MRTTKFQKVFDRVVRLLGRDPLAELPQDMERAIIDHINERVLTAWQAWDWPEWTLTEERAFRQIWTPTDQYKVESDEDGQPEEVYYLTNQTYYRVLADAPSDPPIGTLPTDDTYWEELPTPIDMFIAYDQRCRRAIGRVIGIYNRNPRNGCSCHATGLSFHPSEKGLDLCASGLTTVFITHIMPTPEYTMMRFIEGRTYRRADVVFDPATGECFQAVTTTTEAPESGDDWRWVPFPQKWVEFVVNGAFADCLTEFDQGGNDDIQQKFAISSKAEDRAINSLQARIDELQAQGQKVLWNFCRRGCYWTESVPFTSGTVSTLTATCEDELGWVFPVPTPSDSPFCDKSYHDEIVAILTADGTPSLEGLATITRRITCTLITIVIEVDGAPEAQQWRLDAGPADVDDEGQVEPSDYNASTNDKHWTKVG